MNPKYLPPDAVLPDDMEESLEDIIREEAVKVCPVGFPTTNFAGLVSKVILSGRVKTAIIESHGENLLSDHERETVARVISEMIDAENPRLRAQCYDLAFRLNLRVGSMTQDKIAEEHGIGKAAVSKECRRIVREFHLPPARGMKSTQAVEVYRDREIKKHKKRREEHQAWEFGIEFAQAMSRADENTSVLNK